MSQENNNSKPFVKKDFKEGGNRDRKFTGNNDNKVFPRNNRNRNQGNRPPRQFDNIKYEVLRGERITKVTAGGKTMRFRTIAMAGDYKGRVGFALSKARQQNTARDKAKLKAAKRMINVPVNKLGTIPHEIMGKFGACKVFIKPAPEGTGIIAGGTVRKILSLAGIRNIYSKVYGSRTKANVVKATMNALENLKTATKIAELRGKEVKEIFRP